MAITLDEFIADLETKLEFFEGDENIPLARASLSTHQRASKRIFSDNLDVNGRELVFKFPNGENEKVKPGEKLKKRPRLGPYSRSYALFKEKFGTGRTVTKVDLFLSGDFRFDYMNAGSPGASFPRRINKNLYVAGFFQRGKKNISHIELSKVFEESYYETEIFTLSEEEVEFFYEIATKEFYEILEE